MDLPKGWEIKELREVCDIYNGSTPSRSNPNYWCGDILWATPTDVSNLKSKYIKDTKNKITKEGYDSCSTKILPFGSVLYTSRASIGHIAITKKEICTNQGFKNFVCKKGLIPEFLYYCLKTKKKDIEKFSSGSTFKEISMSSIKKVTIPIPPLSTQHKIVKILEKAESIKQKRQQIEELTNQVLQSVFVEMFGDPETNPKGWNFEPIGEHVVKNQTRNPKKQPNEKFVYVDITSIDNKVKSIVAPKEINSSEAPSRARKVIRKGDVLVSTVRPNLNAVAMVPRDLDNQICSTGFCVLRSNNSLDTRYLFEITKSQYFINALVLKATGASYPAVTDKIILEVKIPIPPSSLQQKFANIVEKVEAMKQKQLENKKYSEGLFNSLMQRSFSGKLVN